MNFNKVIVAGNLTRDPELKYTPSGAALCEFGIAINRQWKTQNGEDRKEVSFIDIIAWGRLAEVVNQYFAKGRPILVEGRLEQNRWETNEGQKRSKIKIVLESFQFVGGRRDEDDNNQPEDREPMDGDGDTPF